MDDPTLALALDTLKIQKQALIFVNTKRSAEKTAEDLSKVVKDSRANPIITDEIQLIILRNCMVELYEH